MKTEICLSLAVFLAFSSYGFCETGDPGDNSAEMLNRITLSGLQSGLDGQTVADRIDSSTAPVGYGPGQNQNMQLQDWSNVLMAVCGTDQNCVNSAQKELNDMYTMCRPLNASDLQYKDCVNKVFTQDSHMLAIPDPGDSDDAETEIAQSAVSTQFAPSSQRPLSAFPSYDLTSPGASVVHSTK